MKKNKDDINAVLGKDTKFEGKLTFSGAVRIDGFLKGEIFTEGTLIVGETGIIESDIDASHVIISGKVRGNITAKNKIEIHAPAKVAGNLRAPVIKMDEGVVFDGTCQMDGEKGYALARINRYDCILLDLNLPKIDGIELAKKLRNEQYNVPIIMVTARSQMYDKLEGFDSGADDYITKPFDLKELLARIKAVIKT